MNAILRGLGRRLPGAVLVCLLAAAPLWGQDGEERWMAIGLGYENYLEFPGKDIFSEDFTYQAAAGFTISAFLFGEGKPVGFMFTEAAFPVPVMTVDEISSYNFYEVAVIMGPAFRVSPSDRLTLYGGLGLEFAQLIGTWRDAAGVNYEDSRANLGVELEGGIKFDLTDRFYLAAGAAVSWSFVSRHNVERRKNGGLDSDGYAQTLVTSFYDYGENYSLITIRPFLAMGWNFYAPKMIQGKPPRDAERPVD